MLLFTVREREREGDLNYDYGNTSACVCVLEVVIVIRNDVHPDKRSSIVIFLSLTNKARWKAQHNGSSCHSLAACPSVRPTVMSWLTRLLAIQVAQSSQFLCFSSLRN